ncbi:class I SAM-dependent methyltransferase [Aliiroseovarius sp. KMU-50]|uniref:Class I SAM-dependent methyltransferase n=1 Tax=Aliiroseovarius salicola TaxID=3009082 RepID=A0ABT4W495_9RHOB|nr:class I SAM-dependent methyltransferase [Aliiroseovarius sp. KMU-50]MDA5095300.1 class I SAM-dependent methyltransferase [Aliiroseovarius sp. KMU-50]
MDLKSVRASYARWAPIYDQTFGAATRAGRHAAVSYLNAHPGSVLEVGVGTGLALPHYAAEMQVTGIDYSHEMLAKAQGKVAEHGLSHVSDLRQMDARDLDFPDNSFDNVAAMHVLSVVPEPERVMEEIARVCKPGGKVVITNHFKHDTGMIGLIAKLSAPLANMIGWHSDFELQTVLQDPRLVLADQRSLPPVGMMTFLVLEKKST